MSERGIDGVLVSLRSVHLASMSFGAAFLSLAVVCGKEGPRGVWKELEGRCMGMGGGWDG